MRNWQSRALKPIVDQNDHRQKCNLRQVRGRPLSTDEYKQGNTNVPSARKNKYMRILHLCCPPDKPDRYLLNSQREYHFRLHHPLVPLFIRLAIIEERLNFPFAQQKSQEGDCFCRCELKANALAGA